MRITHFKNTAEVAYGLKIGVYYKCSIYSSEKDVETIIGTVEALKLHSLQSQSSSSSARHFIKRRKYRLKIYVTENGLKESITTVYIYSRKPEKSKKIHHPKLYIRNRKRACEKYSPSTSNVESKLTSRPPNSPDSAVSTATVIIGRSSSIVISREGAGDESSESYMYRGGGIPEGNQFGLLGFQPSVAKITKYLPIMIGDEGLIMSLNGDKYWKLGPYWLNPANWTVDDVVGDMICGKVTSKRGELGNCTVKISPKDSSAAPPSRIVSPCSIASGKTVSGGKSENVEFLTGRISPLLQLWEFAEEALFTFLRLFPYSTVFTDDFAIGTRLTALLTRLAVFLTRLLAAGITGSDTVLARILAALSTAVLKESSDENLKEKFLPELALESAEVSTGGFGSLSPDFSPRISTLLMLMETYNITNESTSAEKVKKWTIKYSLFKDKFCDLTLTSAENPNCSNIFVKICSADIMTSRIGAKSFFELGIFDLILAIISFSRFSTAAARFRQMAMTYNKDSKHLINNESSKSKKNFTLLLRSMMAVRRAREAVISLKRPFKIPVSMTTCSKVREIATNQSVGSSPTTLKMSLAKSLSAPPRRRPLLPLRRRSMNKFASNRIIRSENDVPKNWENELTASPCKRRLTSLSSAKWKIKGHQDHKKSYKGNLHEFCAKARTISTPWSYWSSESDPMAFIRSSPSSSNSYHPRGSDSFILLYTMGGGMGVVAAYERIIKKSESFFQNIRFSKLSQKLTTVNLSISSTMIFCNLLALAHRRRSLTSLPDIISQSKKTTYNFGLKLKYSTTLRIPHLTNSGVSTNNIKRVRHLIELLNKAVVKSKSLRRRILPRFSITSTRRHDSSLNNLSCAEFPKKIKKSHNTGIKTKNGNAEKLQLKRTSRNIRKEENFSIIFATIGAIRDNQEKYVNKNVKSLSNFSLVSATKSTNGAGIEQKSGESNQWAQRQKLSTRTKQLTDDHLHTCT